MKMKHLFLPVLFAMMSACYGQQHPDWSKWSWLTGEWQGEGTGKPGSGGGTFSFRPDLDGNILVRRSHSEYPSRDNKGTAVHEDLMVVYPEAGVSPSKAVYFDNEGHVINYGITYGAGSIVFFSNKISNAPVFRLTYDSVDRETVNTRFEMSQDGMNFMLYLEGKSRQIKSIDH
jgi:hypothetical protein